MAMKRSVRADDDAAGGEGRGVAVIGAGDRRLAVRRHRAARRAIQVKKGGTGKTMTDDRVRIANRRRNVVLAGG